MTQPKPTTATIDGITVQQFYYPETGTALNEYYESGCLVIVGNPGIFSDDGKKRRDLNVRLDVPSNYRSVDLDRDWAALWPVYTAACARHGFASEDETKMRAFFDKTQGMGVLWAWLPA